MINYYEQGGAAQEDQQDAMLQKAIIGFYGYQKQQGNDTSIQDVVSQVAQLISKQPETLEQIAASDELVEAGAKIFIPGTVCASWSKVEFYSQSQRGVPRRILQDILCSRWFYVSCM